MYLQEYEPDCLTVVDADIEVRVPVLTVQLDRLPVSKPLLVIRLVVADTGTINEMIKRREIMIFNDFLMDLPSHFSIMGDCDPIINYIKIISIQVISFKTDLKHLTVREFVFRIEYPKKVPDVCG